MNYSMHIALILATLGSKDSRASEPTKLHDDLLATLAHIEDLAAAFQAKPITPQATFDFEEQLQIHLRELGRRVVQHTFNTAEPALVQTLPGHLDFQSNSYTRLGEKTNQKVWTLFGEIGLSRLGYRSTSRTADVAIFPLAQSLGLIEGVTPALASRVGAFLGSTGQTQSLVLQRLHAENGIGWGVSKLRRVLATLSEMLAAQRHDAQLARLLELLEEARISSGKHKPVLSVGRDGITVAIRIKKGKVLEVATTATLSVFDRRGKRLGTVYLAYAPQSEQVRMSAELTRLLQAVLLGWEGPLPRLCYVSDAGHSETAYYTRELVRMKHPRTGEVLEWIRVLDYYHASTRLWTLAECLFGQGRQASRWVRKMQKWLLLPGGINRVLHSAAAYQARAELSRAKQKEYATAYSYLRSRMKMMRYNKYRQVNVPLGSGVTEAGCKTIFTQRLKLSGMAWQTKGAQNVLNLRVLLVSEVWERAFHKLLATLPIAKLPTHEAFLEKTAEKAA